MDPNQLWMRARNELLAAYDASGQPYYATTRPYKSTQMFVFTVTSGQPVGAATIAYAKLLKGQRVLWFDYGVGDTMPWAPGTANPTKIASDADTNMDKGRQTLGVEDFVIEAISASHRATRVAYAPGTAVVPGDDNDVVDMFIGNLAVYDPGSLFAPPQVQSPFNLEDALYEALKPQTSVKFLWDSKSLLPVGTLDEFPEGGAKSFLKASGDPRTDNRYKVPEGYTWRKQGLKDSDFCVIGQVEDTVIVPITLVQTDAAGAVRQPLYIYVDITMRLHGIAIDGVGRNV